jgi:hypothetical protein
MARDAGGNRIIDGPFNRPPKPKWRNGQRPLPDAERASMFTEGFGQGLNYS